MRKLPLLGPAEAKKAGLDLAGGGGLPSHATDTADHNSPQGASAPSAAGGCGGAGAGGAWDARDGSEEAAKARGKMKRQAAQNRAGNGAGRGAIDKVVGRLWGDVVVGGGSGHDDDDGDEAGEARTPLAAAGPRIGIEVRGMA